MTVLSKFDIPELEFRRQIFNYYMSSKISKRKKVDNCGDIPKFSDLDGHFETCVLADPKIKVSEKVIDEIVGDIGTGIRKFVKHDKTFSPSSLGKEIS